MKKIVMVVIGLALMLFGGEALAACDCKCHCGKAKIEQMNHKKGMRNHKKGMRKHKKHNNINRTDRKFKKVRRAKMWNRRFRRRMWLRHR